MKKLLGLYKQLISGCMVGIAFLMAGSAVRLGAEKIQRCVLEIPLSGSKKVISDQESKVISKNMRLVVDQVEKIRAQLGISNDDISWQVPHDILKKCHIPIPTYTNRSGFKITLPDCMVHITLRDMGKVVEEYCDEVVENLDLVCQKGIFGGSNTMIPVSMNKIGIFYETSPYKNDDTVVVTLKIESPDLNRVASIIDGYAVCNRGCARDEEFLPHITVATFNNLSHNNAQKLVNKLNAVKDQIFLNSKQIRLRTFSIAYGASTCGTWSIRHFIH